MFDSDLGFFSLFPLSFLQKELVREDEVAVGKEKNAWK